MLVVTPSAEVARFCSALFSTYAMLLKDPITGPERFDAKVAEAIEYAVNNQLCVRGAEVVVMTSTFATEGRLQVGLGGHLASSGLSSALGLVFVRPRKACGMRGAGFHIW